MDHIYKEHIYVLNFPVEFYQHCWEIIKEDLLRLLQDFHDLKLEIGRFNYRIITLLLKVKDANKIQQYRLLNVIYKIFTKQKLTIDHLGTC
jgi:hypothetical protein